MIKEDYLKNMKILEKEYKQKINQLKKNFALNNNSIRIGEIITDVYHNIKIKVKKIQFATEKEFPQCVYSGVKLIKQNKPYKNGEKETI